MYPFEVVNIIEKRHGHVPAVISRNIRIPHKGIKFKELRKIRDNYLYDGKRGIGVIVPFNVGPISEGKVTVVGTDVSREKVRLLFEEITLSLKRLI